MFKKRIIAVLAAVMMSCATLTVGAIAAAPGLDDVSAGTALPSSSSSQSQPSSGGSGLTDIITDANADQVDVGTAPENIGDVFANAGLKEEDIEKANETVTPIVKFVNYGLGILVALLGTVLLAVTILDLVYIVSPNFIRNIGGGNMAQQSMGGMGGMGMGGMGMGGGAAPMPQKHGFAALISDDCIAAMQESGAAAASGGAAPMGGMGMGGMGMGMGGMGMGMGGMGMGGMGMGGAPAAPKAKAVIAVYLKKRVFTLILIGVCVVVLTCTCFLDVGMKLGMWVTNLISGVI